MDSKVAKLSTQCPLAPLPSTSWTLKVIIAREKEKLLYRLPTPNSSTPTTSLPLSFSLFQTEASSALQRSGVLG